MNDVMSAAFTLGMLTLAVSCTGRQSEWGATTAAPYDSSSASTRVSGTILFEGPRPEPAPVRMGGSLFCVRHGQGRTSQRVSITEDNKLQNVIVYVRSGHEGRVYTVPSDPVILDQKDCVYVPRVVTLMAGQPLEIGNSDDTFHNVHAESSVNRPFNLVQAVMGSKNTEIFSKAEAPFRIGCDMHPWMSTYVGVFDHPFHTTVNAEGFYSINLPPGKFEIVAWHEKYGAKTASVETRASQTTELNFTFSESGAAE